MRSPALSTTSAIILAMMAYSKASAQSPAPIMPLSSTAVSSQGNQQRESVQSTPQDGSLPPSVMGDGQVAEESGLADIVVTAQRRSESAQRAGLAISVLSGSTVAERGVTTPSDLSQLIPAVSIQPAGGSATTFFVRGVGNFAVNGYTDPAIAFNYDGVYVGRATATQGLLYDLDRIELLKGPQGTLYGRNATSGAVNVLPARPRIGQNSGTLVASYGNYDALNVQGAVNLAVGEQAALRIAGLRSQHDGYLSDGTSDEKLTAVRAQLLVNLTEALTVRIGGDYAHVGGAGVGASYAVSYRYDATANGFTFTPSGLKKRIGLFDPAAQAYRQGRFNALSGRNLAPLDRFNYIDNDLYGFNAEVTWNSPLGTLTVIPAFRSGNINQVFTTPATEAYLQEKDAQHSIEARLAGDRLGNVVDYILGLYFFKESVDGNYTFNQEANSPFQDFKSRTNAKAAFARLTVHLTDNLRLIGGIRYTDERKRFDGAADLIQVVCTVRVAGVPSCPGAPAIPTVDNASQVGFSVPAVSGGVLPIGTTGAIARRLITSVNTGQKANKVNYRVAAEFDLAPASLLYASFENGFRSGAFSLSAGYETYKPEYIDAYTIGIKNRLLDNRLQLNLEAFLWKYRDQQVTHPGLDRNGAQGQFTENIGRSKNRGVEAEARLLLTPETLLSTDVQYLDAKYDSFVFQVPAGNTPPLTGCAFSRSTANAALYNIDCSGKRGYQSPRWTINFAAQQAVRVPGAEIILNVDTQYKARRVVGFDYLPFQTVGSNWLSSAQLSVKPDALPITASIYVQNIENNRVPVASFNYALPSIFSQITTPPRTYGVRVSAKF